MRLGGALSAVKDKWKDVPKSDYSLILKNTLEKMREDPDAAVRYFDRQFLARHNFLMKKFPPEFGNLREGIQEMFPSDFCAQLAELDSRLDSRFPERQARRDYDGGKKQMEDFFYKNVFIKQAGGMSFCCYFVEVAGEGVPVSGGDAPNIWTGSLNSTTATWYLKVPTYTSLRIRCSHAPRSRETCPPPRRILPAARYSRVL